MLDKLVESKNSHQEKKTLRIFFLTTSTLTISGVIFALVFSLFSQTLAMNADAIALTTLVTPTELPDEKPEIPKPLRKTKSKAQKNIKNALPTRKKNILRLDESPKKVPKGISTSPLKDKARPNSVFESGPKDLNPPKEEYSLNRGNKAKSASFSGKFGATKPIKVNEDKRKTVKKKTIQKPPPLPPVAKAKKPTNTIVSLGVINGKARKLVTPAYPAAAKAIQLKGKVTVQVMISKEGKIISAKAINGHRLLRRNAVNAARKSTFTPTLLSKKKVKVRGLIVYNFN